MIQDHILLSVPVKFCNIPTICLNVIYFIYLYIHIITLYIFFHFNTTSLALSSQILSAAYLNLFNELQFEKCVQTPGSASVVVHISFTRNKFAITVHNPK